MALKKGDRVTVKVRDDPAFNGVITGESRDGHGWQMIKDGTKWPRGIHKSFCFPEVILPTIPLVWPDGQPVLAGELEDGVEYDFDLVTGIVGSSH